ncbi:hypothetical protein PG1629B_0941 [Bifidobacterium pseudolongum subsp. pseudolongum]|nr:hypothetical protein CQR52_0309 [Bifidobacterium pseudolongum subsp. pseudolongum]PKV08055.1 hypothetical protein CQR49_0964 [Bifidobacterium pseudolongum subsp. pseudolongum]RYQ49916.1 hypothetical protein PG1629B_0941 [Bifidobacterium pseudolongum subsp. pseudolongum]RYQ54558.1 hypothetical protein PG1604B_0928 [Bifidobacterium pseudolongum subsp. pseudolongum]RYQ63091.1 hypothetical protein PG1513B_0939 [Bifidobacterium pseudolongum subsp. pseudolongum]
MDEQTTTPKVRTMEFSTRLKDLRAQSASRRNSSRGASASHSRPSPNGKAAQAARNWKASSRSPTFSR